MGIYSLTLAYVCQAVAFPGREWASTQEAGFLVMVKLKTRAKFKFFPV